MPYDIKKSGGKWKLVKKDGGKVVGTHDSKAAAEAQRRAIYANEKRPKSG